MTTRGDYDVSLYPSEDILYLQFARSNAEASKLVDAYRSTVAEAIGQVRAERLAYRRRNVAL